LDHLRVTEVKESVIMKYILRGTVYGHVNETGSAHGAFVAVKKCRVHKKLFVNPVTVHCSGIIFTLPKVSYYVCLFVCLFVC